MEVEDYAICRLDTFKEATSCFSRVCYYQSDRSDYTGNIGCFSPVLSEYVYFEYKLNIAHYIEELEKLNTLCNYETSNLRARIDSGTSYLYDISEYWIYDSTIGREKPVIDEYGFWKTGHAYTNTPCSYLENHYDSGVTICIFTQNQYEQIKKVDLDCGEGGSVKGKVFILSEDEIRKYYSDGSKFCLWNPYDGKTFWTRTRVKGSDGKMKLWAVKTNSDGTVKEFVQLDGYDTGAAEYFIPAICVKPAP